MKKLLLIFIFLSTTLINTANAKDELEGDVRLACEAILCLAALGSAPSECAKSLKKFFSFKGKSLKQIINARKNFLKGCPKENNGQSDAQYDDYLEKLTKVDDSCSPEMLNNNVEEKIVYFELYGEPASKSIYRIDPTLPPDCRALSSHDYAILYKPRYTCSGEFYEQDDWFRGAVERNGAVVRINKNCWKSQ